MIIGFTMVYPSKLKMFAMASAICWVPKAGAAKSKFFNPTSRRPRSAAEWIAVSPLQSPMVAAYRIWKHWMDRMDRIWDRMDRMVNKWIEWLSHGQRLVESWLKWSPSQQLHWLHAASTSKSRFVSCITHLVESSALASCDAWCKALRPWLAAAEASQKRCQLMGVFKNDIQKKTCFINLYHNVVIIFSHFLV